VAGVDTFESGSAMQKPFKSSSLLYNCDLMKINKIYATCPKCGEKIDYLEVEHMTISKIYPIDYDKLIWDNDNWDGYKERYHYLCPECHKEIAKNEDEVLELFNKELGIKE